MCLDIRIILRKLLDNLSKIKVNATKELSKVLKKKNHHGVTILPAIPDQDFLLNCIFYHFYRSLLIKVILRTSSHQLDPN